MTLTPLQRKTLERYRMFRESPPTLRKLATLAFPSHLLLFIVMGLLGVVSHLYVDESLIIWVVGVAVGAIARDFAAFRTVVRIWPAISQVIDFQKVDEALDS